MTVDSAYSNLLPSLKLVGDTLSVSALIGRVTLTFDFEPGVHYYMSGGQPSYQLLLSLCNSNGCSERVLCSRCAGWRQWLQLQWRWKRRSTDWMLVFLGVFVIDLWAKLTFNLGGHGACGWYQSSCSICVPRLNFVGLPIRNIWHTFGLIISRLGLGDLDLWAFDPETGAQYCWWDGQPSYQFHVISWLWPLTLEVMALVGDTGLRFLSVY